MCCGSRKTSTMPTSALTGGIEFNDHRLIWGKLGQVRAKFPEMILLHRISPKAAELGSRSPVVIAVASIRRGRNSKLRGTKTGLRHQPANSAEAVSSIRPASRSTMA
jgi:hypothetical protein